MAAEEEGRQMKSYEVSRQKTLPLIWETFRASPYSSKEAAAMRSVGVAGTQANWIFTNLRISDSLPHLGSSLIGEKFSPATRTLRESLGESLAFSLQILSLFLSVCRECIALCRQGTKEMVGD